MISVQNLSKAYRIGVAEEKHHTLVTTLASWAKYPLLNFRRLRALNASRDIREAADVHWALRDISFEVKKGEVVGIIGRNGAGKSTLLKILSKITKPTGGRAVIRGRVSSLLEVGTGFHPELTGRDNVYMNGTILGMRKREIDAKFDEIVSFSGVEKFLDTPIKRYSSGMKVRLAFAVAAHLEPEILVIDEVLAVGDQEFQDKCLGKMHDVAGSGRTVLFVSHNLAAVEGLCSAGVLLEQGTLAYSGSVSECIQRYIQSDQLLHQYSVELSNHANRTINGSRIFESIRLTDIKGETLSCVELGRPVHIEIMLKGDQVSQPICVGIHFYDQFSRRLATCHTSHQHARPIVLKDSLLLRCRIPEFWLLPGDYYLVLGLASGNEQLDRIEPALSFSVVPRDVFGTGRLPQIKDGAIVMNASWTFSAEP